MTLNIRSIIPLFSILLISVVSITIVTSACSVATKNNVITGADILISEKLDLIKGKNLALVINHTSLLSDGKHLADELYKLSDKNNIKIRTILTPEHGLKGNIGTGDEALHSREQGTYKLSQNLQHNFPDNNRNTGIPVRSIYGMDTKPLRKGLKGIGIVIFDMQDIGTRFYTHISVLYNLVEVCAEKGIKIITRS